MSDRKPQNEKEVEARQKLALLAQSMIEGKLSFLDASIAIHGLRSQIGGIKEQDQDFNAFTAIISETDHLPSKEQRGAWNSQSLADLASEFKQKEEWARSISLEACRNLIKRFSPDSTKK